MYYELGTIILLLICFMNTHIHIYHQIISFHQLPKSQIYVEKFYMFFTWSIYTSKHFFINFLEIEVKYFMLHKWWQIIIWNIVMYFSPSLSPSLPLSLSLSTYIYICVCVLKLNVLININEYLSSLQIALTHIWHCDLYDYECNTCNT